MLTDPLADFGFRIADRLEGFGFEEPEPVVCEHPETYWREMWWGYCEERVCKGCGKVVEINL